MPLYLGLIIAQAVYVIHFMVELEHLVTGTFKLSEEAIMLIVLGLIDVVMISNLLIMAFIVSAVAIAYIGRLMPAAGKH